MRGEQVGLFAGARVENQALAGVAAGIGWRLPPRPAHQPNPGGDEPHGEPEEAANGGEAEHLARAAKRDGEAFTGAQNDRERGEEAERGADGG